MKSKIYHMSIIAIPIIFFAVISIFIILPLLTSISALPIKAAGNELRFCNSPLDKYYFTACKVFSCYYNDEVYLTEEQKNEFLDVLFDLEMDKIGTSDYFKYAGVGNSFSYAVKFADGEIIDVNVISDYYIVIGPKAYRCYNSEKLKFLDKYAFEIYEAVKGYE